MDRPLIQGFGPCSTARDLIVEDDLRSKDGRYGDLYEYGCERDFADHQ
jgi:hypothetical protein